MFCKNFTFGVASNLYGIFSICFVRSFSFDSPYNMYSVFGWYKVNVLTDPIPSFKIKSPQAQGAKLLVFNLKIAFQTN